MIGVNNICFILSQLTNPNPLKVAEGVIIIEIIHGCYAIEATGSLEYNPQLDHHIADAGAGIILLLDKVIIRIIWIFTFSWD